MSMSLGAPAASAGGDEDAAAPSSASGFPLAALLQQISPAHIFSFLPLKEHAALALCSSLCLRASHAAPLRYYPLQRVLSRVRDAVVERRSIGFPEHVLVGVQSPVRQGELLACLPACVSEVELTFRRTYEEGLRSPQLLTAEQLSQLPSTVRKLDAQSTDVWIRSSANELRLPASLTELDFPRLRRITPMEDPSVDWVELPHAVDVSDWAEFGHDTAPVSLSDLHLPPGLTNLSVPAESNLDGIVLPPALRELHIGTDVVNPKYRRGLSVPVRVLATSYPLLPVLPPSLTRLSLDNSFEQPLPQPLPPSLTQLDLPDGLRLAWDGQPPLPPLIFPPALRALELPFMLGGQLRDVPLHLSSLESLTVCGPQPLMDVRWPASLTSLTVGNSSSQFCYDELHFGIEDVCEWPASLTELTLNCQLSSLRRWTPPPNLLRFFQLGSVGEHDVDETPLPPTLQQLHWERYSRKRAPWNSDFRLPPSLTALNLDRENGDADFWLRVFEVLPPSLLVLSLPCSFSAAFNPPTFVDEKSPLPPPPALPASLTALRWARDCDYIANRELCSLGAKPSLFRPHTCTLIPSLLPRGLRIFHPTGVDFEEGPLNGLRTIALRRAVEKRRERQEKAAAAVAAAASASSSSEPAEEDLPSQISRFFAAGALLSRLARQLHWPPALETVVYGHAGRNFAEFWKGILPLRRDERGRVQGKVHCENFTFRPDLAALFERPPLQPSSPPVERASAQPSLSHPPPCGEIAASSPSYERGNEIRAPRSRLNFVTFDRIAQIDLGACLQPPSGPSSVGISTAASAEGRSSPTFKLAGHVGAFSVHSLSGLLSSSECASLSACTLQQDSLSGEYTPSSRDSTRLLVHSPSLADALWPRVSAAVDQLCTADPTLRPLGFGSAGVWRPRGLNPVWRAAAYQPGSRGFQPHRDAPFVQQTAVRSIFTLLIYLTGGAEDAESREDDGALSSADAAAASKDGTHIPAPDASLDGVGCTSFYESINFTAGLPMREETLRRVLRVRPTVGIALLFPHHLPHSGDALASHVPSAKLVLRSDVLFERVNAAPLLPIAHPLNWRRDSNFLRALELFQRAFKFELAGKLEEASDAYERSSSLRAESVIRAAEEARRAGLAVPSPALDESLAASTHADISSVPPSSRNFSAGVSADAMRIVASFLDGTSARQLWSTCRDWRSLRAHPAGPLQLRRARLCGGAMLRSSPPLAPVTAAKPLSPRALAGQAAARSLYIRRLLPRISHIDGLGCLFTYPRRFFSAHRAGCRRVMAVLAAAALSHHLPQTETDDEEAVQRLLTAPFVFSYERAVDAEGGRVAWCSVGELLRAVFRMEHATMKVGTLAEFNAHDGSADEGSNAALSVAANAMSSAVATASLSAVSASASSAGSSSVISPAPSSSPVWRTFCVSCNELAADHEAERPQRLQKARHAVSLFNLLPTFYHAGMCCSQEHAENGARHEFGCEVQHHRNTLKRQAQKARHLEHRRRNAEEQRTFDEATPVASSSSSAASASSFLAGSDAARPAVVTLQEMRASRGFIAFRAHYVGMPAL